MILPDGSELALPTLERRRVRLRLTRPVRFHFLHGGVLHGLLCRIFGHLPDGLVPFAAESGQVDFDTGDAYVFGVTAFGEGRALLDRLGDGLRHVGSGRREGHGRTLASNFEVEAIETIEAPTLDAIHERAALLAEPRPAALHFLSPLRLSLPEALRRDGRRYAHAGAFPADLFLDRLYRRWHQVTTGDFPAGRDVPAPPRGVSADARDLTWMDLPVPGRHGKAGRPKGMTLGGVLGEVRLDGLTPPWCALLAAAELVHLGQSVRYGFGRYHLVGAWPLDDEPFQPARSLLDRATDERAVERAWTHVAGHSKAAGVDRVAPASLDGRDLESLRAELRDDRYRADDLLGFLQPKADGGWRPLAVPTARDRVAQRAAVDVLAPSIDAILADCSFAYRKGFSRQAAARAIRRAYDDGFRWVLDADIESFFDSVEWPRLLARLRALFPFEPLVDAIRQWVRAPVQFRGQTLERDRGLPQGSPIAPLLANLFLDAFDDEILDQDFRLVRYADDFVILCRDPESVRHARDAARRALGDLGLELNEEKTGLRSFDDGFRYLGYLFCRSLVLDESRDDTPLEDRPPPAATGWLGALPLRSLRKLRRQDPRDVVEVVPLASEDGMRSEGRRPLYLAHPETTTRVDGDALVLEPIDASPERTPIRSLHHVVCLGRTRLTVPAVVELARQDVPVYLCRPTGELDAVVSRPAENWSVWQAQVEAIEDSRLRRDVARAIAAAKLRNAATLAVRFELHERQRVASTLRALADDTESKDTADALRGLEGRGARVFFEAFGASLPEGWPFSRRQRRPPPDPVNSLLSFGYSLLHHHASTALAEAGLNPHLGLFHEPSPRYAALASDLVEELRHLVDALVWTLIRRRQLRPDRDFVERRGGRAVWMTREARKLYVEAFEDRLLTEFRPPDEEDRLTYREFLFQQAVQIRHLVLGKVDRYQPLVITA